jgi:2-deoxy-D-gluconate 3-dehydrogenase
MVSKAGLNQMVRALGAEWARYGIRVNGIAPGYFDTEMPAAVLADPVMKDMILKAIPVKRIGRPREIGPLAVYLASEVSDYVNGEIIRIDGGQSL